ncbi:NAD(P)-dependent oxidoreductase [Rhizorhabdus wittichii]|uniref:NAD(P)-dependent oxidoreductase n=1 Tax=Rhizorhabdus wittichii TaxID=160791 RepID=A0A975HDC2_9SPHN|nr:NAD(P)-dependent oxidoreductase [Rhizorhabdus wittichii]QTH21162.1 NAD(P)-dependent oxidoreductase [Rhizorhabdus wittichii]
MLKDRRILVTGVTGKAVVPIAAALARDNEVWGQARFTDARDRAAIAALGIRPCAADLGSGDVGDLPADVDYVLHFAWMRAAREALEQAMRVNVEGAGLVLHHCRSAKAALVVSSTAAYLADPDPWHRYREGDPVGPGLTAAAATSPVCKIGLEAMARFSARAHGLPVTIARLNTVLGPHQAFFGKQVTAVLEGREIVLPSDTDTHSPIHSEDMIRQIGPLLDAAGRAPLTVNWCGDDVAISQDTIARIGERAGKAACFTVRSAPGLAGGNISDPEKRRSITGPCLTSFGDGFERLLDEMLDGAPSPLPQRDWAYGSGAQNQIFKGVA